MTLFQGTSLRPIPPVESEQDDVRYFHIHENDQFDEELVTGWIRQASELPGDELFWWREPCQVQLGMVESGPAI